MSILLRLQRTTGRGVIDLRAADLFPEPRIPAQTIEVVGPLDVAAVRGAAAHRLLEVVERLLDVARGGVVVGDVLGQVGAPDASYFRTLGTLFAATYDWMGQLLGARVFASLAALPFYYLLYRSKLLPRFISVWGLIGAPLYLASGLLAMFGLVDPLSPILVLLFLPAALLEMVLAVWLIVKGFNSSAFARLERADQ